MRPESWKPVAEPGFEELYRVSDMGRVQSYDRPMTTPGGSSWVRRGKILAPAPDSRGYLGVCLYSRGGKKEIRKVSRLVLAAFDRPCPPGMEALHGPAGKLVNWWPENLEWGTRSKNAGVDKHRDGVMTQAKLTAEIVLVCRSRRARSGDFYADMATEYGVSEETLRRAVIGRTWKHLPGAVAEPAHTLGRPRTPEHCENTRQAALRRWARMREGAQ